MQAKATTLLSNLRARNLAASKRRSAPSTSTKLASSSPGSLHLFAFPTPSTSSTSSSRLMLPPQSESDRPISPLTLHDSIPPHSRPQCITMHNAPTISETTKDKANKAAILDVSLLRETRNIRSGKGTAITPRRGRKAQKVEDDAGSLADQLEKYCFEVAGGEGMMARSGEMWEGCVSPKTVVCGDGFVGEVGGGACGGEREFGEFGLGFGLELGVDCDGFGDKVPGLVADVGAEDETMSDASAETIEGSRKRSWEEYDADDESEEFDVEAWLDGEMESGEEDILYEMAKKAVVAMGYDL